MRDHISYSSKTSEIKMLCNKGKYKDKTFILLEGKTDIKLFRSLFLSEYVQIESLDGKDNVENALLDLSKQNENRIIGVCDADFDHLNKRAISSPVLFLTDTHDSETMMIESSGIDALISEYANKSYYEGLKRRLLDDSLSVCYEIGLARWVNNKENLGINFNNMSFDKVLSVNKLNIKFSIDAFVEHLIEITKNSKIDKMSFLNKINEHRKKGECKFQVCCGHDVTRIISIMLSQKDIGVNFVSHKSIESGLRISYGIIDFKKTKLYSKLIDWQFTCSKNILA